MTEYGNEIELDAANIRVAPGPFREKSTILHYIRWHYMLELTIEFTRLRRSFLSNGIYPTLSSGARFSNTLARDSCTGSRAAVAFNVRLLGFLAMVARFSNAPLPAPLSASVN